MDDLQGVGKTPDEKHRFKWKETVMATYKAVMRPALECALLLLFAFQSGPSQSSIPASR